MTKPKQSGDFLGHRFSPEIIAYAVWAYHRFPMSLRDVEDLLAARGIIVGYETIRAWVAKFRSQYAKVIRRDRPKVADKWHLDEVVLPINGKKYWLWRAVDSNGDVLDILVQSRRNKRAADRFFHKLFKTFGAPRVVVTDKLRSYGAALKDLALGIEHRSHKRLNNRSEGSHRPTRRREKCMGRFKSPRQAQQFLSVHDQIQNVFRHRRHTLSAACYRQSRADAHLDLGRHHASAEGCLRSGVRAIVAKIADNLTMPVQAMHIHG
ncbi:IS6-family transposase [Octadecabacter antarcticus 307]|uniref:IS6-family transposase n=1 Tax=Octadecabacter antarcticus 307 TaxID=391626 RepID=M9RCZ6_9RHOB|nr:IS6 family transposase [Octadecabacter antarcticus]AGI70042.1 IS6-family transposase [Octadecabacter antarcticus 307]